MFNLTIELILFVFAVISKLVLKGLFTQKFDLRSHPASYAMLAIDYWNWYRSNPSLVFSIDLLDVHFNKCLFLYLSGPTDLSMKSLASNSTSSSSSNSHGQGGGGGGASAQLSPPEVTAVRQLIAGYRESAAFLLRSADELENLILQQNWELHTGWCYPSFSHKHTYT